MVCTGITLHGDVVKTISYVAQYVHVMNCCTIHVLDNSSFDPIEAL